MIRHLALAAVVGLVGCQATAPGVSAPAGGTALRAEGDICGRQVAVSLADINDRDGAVLRCFDPATGNQVIELTTSGRGASDAIAAMAESQAKLAGALAGILAAVPRETPRPREPVTGERP